MSQDSRNRLVIAVRFNAAGSKAMAQGMEPDGRNVQFQKDFTEIGAEITGFYGLCGIRYQVVILLHKALERFYHLHQFAANGDIPR